MVGFDDCLLLLFRDRSGDAFQLREGAQRPAFRPSCGRSVLRTFSPPLPFPLLTHTDTHPLPSPPPATTTATTTSSNGQPGALSFWKRETSNLLWCYSVEGSSPERAYLLLYLSRCSPVAHQAQPWFGFVVPVLLVPWSPAVLALDEASIFMWNMGEETDSQRCENSSCLKWLARAESIWLPVTADLSTRTRIAVRFSTVFWFFVAVAQEHVYMNTEC